MKFQMRLFLALSFLFVSLSAQAIKYRWLEQRRFGGSYSAFDDYYDEQSEWFERQREGLEAYQEKAQNLDLREKLESLYSEKKVWQQQTLSDGRSISLYMAAGSYFAEIAVDQQIILDFKRLETIRDEKLMGQGHFSRFHLSPDEKHMVVPIHSDGSSLRTNLAIFKLDGDFELVDLLTDVDRPDSYAWESPSLLRYRPAGKEYGSTYLLNLKTNKVELDRSPDQNVLWGTYQFGRYRAEMRWENSSDQEDDEKQFLKISAFNGLTSEIQVKGDFVERVIGKTGGAFIFGSELSNTQSLLFVGYEESEDNFRLTGYNWFHGLKSGSFQRFWTSGDYFLAEFLSGPFRTYRLFNSQGEQLKILNSPRAGRVIGFRHLEDQKFEFKFASQVVESKEVLVDFRREEWNPDKINKSLLIDNEGSEYIQRNLFIKSIDGTSIPVRVVHKKGIRLNAKTPLYIQAYGGHGLISTFLPGYSGPVHLFLKSDGVYASPGVRGGGEYGNRWYEQVFMTRVRFEDTSESVKALHNLGFGSPETTAFEGWSSGGLLAGVMLTSYPELFKIVVAGNGLYDMIRKEVLFDEAVRGSWIQEWGGHQDQENIDHLMSYSPFEFAKRKAKFPTAYVMAGAYDLRVNPSHSYKFVAALQDHQQGENPILLDRMVSSGHWPASVRHEWYTGLQATICKWQAIFYELGMTEEIATP